MKSLKSIILDRRSRFLLIIGALILLVFTMLIGTTITGFSVSEDVAVKSSIATPGKVFAIVTFVLILLLLMVIGFLIEQHLWHTRKLAARASANAPDTQKVLKRQPKKIAKMMKKSYSSANEVCIPVSKVSRVVVRAPARRKKTALKNVTKKKATTKKPRRSVKKTVSKQKIKKGRRAKKKVKEVAKKKPIRKVKHRRKH